MNLKPFGTGPLGSGPCPSLRFPLLLTCSVSAFSLFLSYLHLKQAELSPLQDLSSSLQPLCLACSYSHCYMTGSFLSSVPQLKCHLLNRSSWIPPTPPHPASRVATSPGHSQQSTYDCGIFSRLVFHAGFVICKSLVPSLSFLIFRVDIIMPPPLLDDFTFS